MRAMPPPFIFFIIFCIWVNCFSNRLTSWTWVPEPFAMRRFLAPLMIAGKRRSLTVMEFMMAMVRAISLSFTCCFTWSGMRPRPGSLSIRDPTPPSLDICSICSRKSSRSNPCPFCSLLASFWALP